MPKAAYRSEFREKQIACSTGSILGPLVPQSGMLINRPLWHCSTVLMFMHILSMQLIRHMFFSAFALQVAIMIGSSVFSLLCKKFSVESFMRFLSGFYQHFEVFSTFTFIINFLLRAIVTCLLLFSIFTHSWGSNNRNVHLSTVG